MKKLIILALFLSACCGITEVSDPCSVTYSDAQPIQFWPVNCDTFNEEEVDGVFRKCFCQPFECDDEVTVQVLDTEDVSYYLSIIDEDEQEITQLPLIETQLPPSAASLPALSSGVNIAGSGPDWTTGANPSVIVTQVGTGSEVSDVWANSYSFIAGNTYIFTFDVDYDFTSGLILQGFIRFVLLDSSNNILSTISSPDLGASSGTYIGPVSFVAPSGAVKYGFSVRITTIGTGTGVVDIDAISAVINPKWRHDVTFTWENLGICNQKVQAKIFRDSTPDVEVLKSDCIHIKTHWDETVLINYYNQRNFAGLVDPSGTPSIDFNLRVPAVFSQERFPKESETIDLSNSRSVQLFSQLKSQKLLETGSIPFYMHKKLNLVLQHQFVTIKNKSWILDSYDIQDSSKRWPLRRALSWLTEKDFVVRNVL